MSVTSTLFRAARVSRTLTAILRGPAALIRLFVRRVIFRLWVRTLPRIR